MLEALQSTALKEPVAPPDVDLGDPATFESGFPLDWFAQARTSMPICWHESRYLKRGFWAISSSTLFDKVMTDAAVFSSEQDTVAFNELSGADLNNARQLLINMDPPRQTAFRRIVSRAFLPDTVAALGARIDAIAHDLMNRIDASAEVDIVSALATEMPLRVMCELLGADPADRLFLGADMEVVNFPDDPDLFPPGANARASAARLFHYGMELLENQKDDTKSLVGMLANGRVNDDVLSTEEFCFFFLFIFMAGYHTTKSMLSSMVNMLASHPDQFEALQRQPELIPNAIEEILRLEPANIHFCRTAMRPVVLHGEQIEEGDKIAVFFHSVNRDAALNDRPDIFDVTRPQVQHRAFGRGIHSCLGAFLARREMQAVLRELVQRHSAITLCGTPIRARSNSLRYFKKIKVRLS